MTRAGLLIAAAVLGGCAQRNVTAAIPATGECKADAAQRFVGQPGDAVQAEALGLTGARVVRRFATGDMLTMDYRADRLNIETDASGRVVRLTCG
ncbi:hypothetical protein KZ810_08730 [Sphingomonas sp. RHCKR47]|uniref:I78 family peptidase inhibitor n=1 Tax=Sphingomonas citricola TaxID=2862498 RepID=UPI001CA5A0E6|nr:I78 family peptidase inhibitor [Sphingomonas citricola]MBW6523579.1 hypothetical protein [Sphingomonas citricola]